MAKKPSIEPPSSPLRVLYLIDSLDSGGAQRQLVTLLSAIDRTMVDPLVAVYHPIWHFKKDIDRLGVPICLLGNSGARDVRVLSRLARLLRTERFDFVHSYLRTPGFLARIASLSSRNTRIIVSERNTDIDHVKWQLALERVLLPLADAMITNADAIRSKVERLLPPWRGRVYVVPNGITFSEPEQSVVDAAKRFREKYVSEKGKILLAVVGRLVPQKDPHLLLDALELLPDRFLSRLCVIWVGPWKDPGFTASVQKRINTTKFANVVHVLPQTLQIRSMYLAMDALALVSRWEGFPNVVLEALAEGKPVIATDVGDVKMLVEDCESGWIVPPGDVTSLAGALKKLVNMEPNHRSKMGKKGLRHVRSLYSSERLARRTLNVYETIISRCPS